MPRAVSQFFNLLRMMHGLNVRGFSGSIAFRGVFAAMCMLATVSVSVLPTTPADAQSFIGTISIRSGPDGEIQISTPWGDYAAYDEGGGYYWVGTQRDFDRQRVIAIERQSGFRLSTVNETGATASFVPEGTLRTHVGGITIDALSPSINFGTAVYDADTHKLYPSMRSVDFSWIQAPGEIPAMFIWSRHDKTKYVSDEVQVVGNGWYIASYTIDKKDLLRPAALVLVARHARPTIIGVSSIAALDYDVATKSEASDASLGVPASSDQVRHLKYLRQLLAQAPSRQQTTHQSRETSTAAAAADIAPTPASQVSRSFGELGQYRGTVTDTKNGTGSINLIFRRRTGSGDGSWYFDFPGKPRTEADMGDIVDLTQSENDTTFRLRQGQGNCDYQVVAQRESDGTLHGLYGSDSCPNSGAFNVSSTPP